MLHLVPRFFFLVLVGITTAVPYPCESVSYMHALSQVRAGKLATSEGLSYLEVKHLLMLHYVCHILFYLILKAEGRSVRDHPVITR
jgi:hypothetical protein